MRSTFRTLFVAVVFVLWNGGLREASGQCTRFQITEQPPQPLGCNPFEQSGDEYLWRLSTACTVRRVSGSGNASFKVHWFHRDTSGTVQDLGRPTFASGPNHERSFYFSNLGGKPFTDSQLGDYWCQVVAEQNMYLGVGNTVTILPPVSYNSTLPTCSGTVTISTMVCADEPPPSLTTTTTVAIVTTSEVVGSSSIESSSTISRSLSSSSSSSTAVSSSVFTSQTTVESTESLATQGPSQSLIDSTTTIRRTSSSEEALNSKSSSSLTTTSSLHSCAHSSRTTTSVEQTSSPSVSQYSASLNEQDSASVTQVTASSEVSFSTVHHPLDCSSSMNGTPAVTAPEPPRGTLVPLLVGIAISAIALALVIAICTCLVIMLLKPTRKAIRKSVKLVKLRSETDIVDPASMERNPVYGSLEEVVQTKDGNHYVLNYSSGRESQNTIHSGESGMETVKITSVEKENSNTNKKHLGYINAEIISSSTSLGSVCMTTSRDKLVGSTEDISSTGVSAARRTYPRYENVGNFKPRKENGASKHTSANQTITSKAKNDSSQVNTHHYANCTIVPVTTTDSSPDKKCDQEKYENWKIITENSSAVKSPPERLKDQKSSEKEKQREIHMTASGKRGQYYVNLGVGNSDTVMMENVL